MHPSRVSGLALCTLVLRLLLLMNVNRIDGDVSSKWLMRVIFGPSSWPSLRRNSLRIRLLALVLVSGNKKRGFGMSLI